MPLAGASESNLSSGGRTLEREDCIMKLLYTPKLKLGTIMYSTKGMSTAKSTFCTIFVQIVRYGLPIANGLLLVVNELLLVVKWLPPVATD